MHTISVTIFNQKYDLKIDYERNENGNVLKPQLEILEMFISYVLYDYLNTSNLLALRDPNYVRPISEMDRLKSEMEELNLKSFKPTSIYVCLPRLKNKVELNFSNADASFKAIFENNKFIGIEID